MMLICSRAFSTDNIAHGSDPTAPPCAAAITRSASITPAIGASTIGNSVLKRSINRRSGHMVCSFREKRKAARALLPGPQAKISTHNGDELCVHGAPLTKAPQRDHGPDRLDHPERPGTLQKSVN